MTASTEEKEFAPTQRRLQEARKRGEVPLGRDLLAAASLGGLTLALVALPGNLIALADIAMGILEQAPNAAPNFTAEGSAGFKALALELLLPCLPLFLLPALLVMVAIWAQQGFVIAPEKLQPKLQRISPLAGAKRKFGRTGLFEFAKSLLKLLLIALALWIYLQSRADLLRIAIGLAPVQTLALLARLLIEFLLIALVMQLGIGALDLLWQRFEHQRQHRMTRKEMKDADGDPQMKGRRRQRAEEIAKNQMLRDVTKAHVVIVNPEHYAVALRWTRASSGAPLCVAKGVDDLARQIRLRAQAEGVPIRRDPPTARALYASVAVGEQIRPEQYRAVAAAIRFAEAIRNNSPRATGRRHGR